MNKKYILTGIGIGAGILAILAMLHFLRTEPGQPYPAQTPGGSPPLGQVPNQNQNKSPAYGLSPNSPPPWADSGTRPAQPADIASLQSIQARLAALSAGGKQPDPRALDALLAELERTQHTTVIGGANIEALRENLAKAAEIGDLAKEMELAAKQPSPDMQKIQGMMDRIKKLQAGLRTDIMVAPAGVKP